MHEPRMGKMWLRHCVGEVCTVGLIAELFAVEWKDGTANGSRSFRRARASMCILKEEPRMKVFVFTMVRQLNTIVCGGGVKQKRFARKDVECSIVELITKTCELDTLHH